MQKKKKKRYVYPDYALTPNFSLSIHFLRKYFLMSHLQQFTLVVVLRLLRSLFLVLGPTCNLWIPNLNLQKVNFNFLLQQHAATPLSSIRWKTWNIKHILSNKLYTIMSIFTLSLYKAKVIICTSLVAYMLF